jgi:hypothetical protein
MEFRTLHELRSYSHTRTHILSLETCVCMHSFDMRIFWSSIEMVCTIHTSIDPHAQPQKFHSHHLPLARLRKSKMSISNFHDDLSKEQSHDNLIHSNLKVHLITAGCLRGYQIECSSSGANRMQPLERCRCRNTKSSICHKALKTVKTRD